MKDIPQVVKMLADPIKRYKLRCISRELDVKKLGTHVWLGCGTSPVMMDKVSELMSAFKHKD